MSLANARTRAPRGTNVLVEQLGAPSSSWGVRDAKDLPSKVLAGALSRAKVVRDQADDGHQPVHPFIEQLGVASGKGGLRDLGDWPFALVGLAAKWSVTRFWGVDVRAKAYELIEHQVLQLPMEEKRKMLLVTALYEIAKRLPDLR